MKHGIPTVVFVVFLVLKLCGLITWSWWWVTSPVWIPAGVFVVLLAILGAIKLVEAGRK